MSFTQDSASHSVHNLIHIGLHLSIPNNKLIILIVDNSVTKASLHAVNAFELAALALVLPRETSSSMYRNQRVRSQSLLRQRHLAV